MNFLRVQKNQVKNLAFKGGSVKGIGYFGCLKALQEVDPNILPGVQRVIGTSAGAITALFVCLNLYEDENRLLQYLSQDFTVFLDMENKTLQNQILALSESRHAKQAITLSTASSAYSSEGSGKLGFASGTCFRDWIETILFEKTGIQDCSFAELNEIGKFKSLYVVAFDLTAKSRIVFSNEETPNAIISDAIRSSISIPYIFEPHKFYSKNLEGQRVIPEDKAEHQLIDGGIALNYPMEIMHEKANHNEILGFYLTTPVVAQSHLKKFPPKQFCSNEENNYKTIYKYKEKNQTNISKINYSKQVYMNYKKFKGQGRKHEKFEREYDRTIYVNNLNVSSLKFNLDEATKGSLIAEGENAVKAYFQTTTPVPVSGPPACEIYSKQGCCVLV